MSRGPSNTHRLHKPNTPGSTSTLPQESAVARNRVTAAAARRPAPQRQHPVLRQQALEAAAAAADVDSGRWRWWGGTRACTTQPARSVAAVNTNATAWSRISTNGDSFNDADMLPPVLKSVTREYAAVPCHKAYNVTVRKGSTGARKMSCVRDKERPGWDFSIVASMPWTCRLGPVFKNPSVLNLPLRRTKSCGLQPPHERCPLARALEELDRRGFLIRHLVDRQEVSAT